MSGFGARVREHREKHNWSLRKLASVINTRIDTISRIELGKQNPHPLMREKLELFLRLPPAENDDVLQQWDGLLESEKFNPVDAFRAVVRFVMKQDEIGRLVILGKLSPTPERLRGIYQALEPKARDAHMQLVAKKLLPPRS